MKPTGTVAAKWLRDRQGSYQLQPGPDHALLFLRAHEDGRLDDRLPPVRLVGQVRGAGELHEIIRMVASGEGRSELHLAMPSGDTRSIFLDGSNLVGAASSVPAERIGEVMRREGALTAKQLESVLQKLAASPGRRFGEIAVELGFLRQDRLFELTARQIEAVFSGVLHANEGSFYLLGDFDDARVAAHHDLPVHRLLAESLARVEELAFFRQHVPSIEHVPLPLEGHGPPPPELAAVFLACDGRRSIGEIVVHTKQSEFEVTRAVYRLVQIGVVRVLGPRPKNLEAAALAFNRAMRAIFQAARINGSEKRLQAQLVSFAEGAGPYDALFDGAGPKEDGTFDVARVGRNAEHLVGAEPSAALTDWLHDYVSFAFFSVGSELPKAALHVLAQQVRGDLKPLTPARSRGARTSTKPPPAPVAAPRAPSPRPVDVAPRAGVAPSPPAPPAAAPAAPRLASAHSSIPPVLGAFAPAPPPLPAPPPVPELAAAPPVATTVAAATHHVEQSSRATAATTTDLAAAPASSPTTSDGSTPATFAQAPRARPRRRAGLLVLAVVAFGLGTALFVVGPSQVRARLGAVLGRATPPAPPPPLPPSPLPTASSPAAPPPTSEASASIVAPSSSETTYVQAPAVSASATSAAPVDAAAPSAAHPLGPVPADRTRLRLLGPSGFRVFVDGHLAGNTPGPLLVPCGAHVVKVGSAGREQSLTLPCGEETSVGR